MRERDEHLALPGFLPVFFQASLSDVILDGGAITVRQVAQFQRQDVIVPNQSGTKTGPETEKEHPPAFVTAEGLHGGVVNDASRFA